MKTRSKVIPMLLCLSVLLTSSLVLTQRVAAKDKESEHITFSEPVMVAGTLLKAETYKVVWDESGGPQVQVSFMKGSHTVVTASARLVLESNAYDGAAVLRTLSDNSKVLEKISWKKKSLVFEPSS
ncbi:MAG TPA: hypothetical protein VK651_00885 [Blastocatellia bacterium]|nr:hypothetical protein [Blastocatellia bacterium]